MLVSLDLMFDIAKPLDRSLIGLPQNDRVVKAAQQRLDQDRFFRERRLGGAAERLDQHLRPRPVPQPDDLVMEGRGRGRVTVAEEHVVRQDGVAHHLRDGLLFLATLAQTVRPSSFGGTTDQASWRSLARRPSPAEYGSTYMSARRGIGCEAPGSQDYSCMHPNWTS